MLRLFHCRPINPCWCATWWASMISHCSIHWCPSTGFFPAEWGCAWSILFLPPVFLSGRWQKKIKIVCLQTLQRFVTGFHQVFYGWGRFDWVCFLPLQPRKSLGWKWYKKCGPNFLFKHPPIIFSLCPSQTSALSKSWYRYRMQCPSVHRRCCHPFLWNQPSKRKERSAEARFSHATVFHIQVKSFVCSLKVKHCSGEWRRRLQRDVLFRKPFWRIPTVPVGSLKITLLRSCGGRILTAIDILSDSVIDGIFIGIKHLVFWSHQRSGLLMYLLYGYHHHAVGDRLYSGSRNIFRTDSPTVNQCGCCHYKNQRAVFWETQHRLYLHKPVSSMAPRRAFISPPWLKLTLSTWVASSWLPFVHSSTFFASFSQLKENSSRLQGLL